MVVVVVLLHVYGVLQLFALAAVARTLRWRVLLMSLAAGVYVCTPTAMLLQLAWTEGAAAVGGQPLSEVAARADLGIVPIVQTVVVLVPLGLLAMLRRVRRQWAVTDLVLLGAALGAGTALADALLRVTAAVGTAGAGPVGGWTVAVRDTWITVPGPVHALLDLLPGVTLGIGTVPGFGPALPTVWGALTGLAVALVLPSRGVRVRVTGCVLLALVVLDRIGHAMEVADGGSSLIRTLLGPLDLIRPGSAFLAVVALVVAAVLDRRDLRRSGVRMPEVLLADEPEWGTTGGRSGLRATVTRWRVIVGRALVLLPWSMLWVSGFLRLRRSLLLTAERTLREEDGPSRPRVGRRDRGERSAQPDDVALLRTSTRRIQQLIRTAARREQPRLWPRLLSLLPGRRPGQVGGWQVADRRAQVVLGLWFLLLLSPFWFFLVAGLRGTAGLQDVVTSPVGFVVTAVLAAVAAGWAGFSAARGLRAYRGVLRHPYAEVPALVGIHLSVGIGMVVGVLGCLVAAVVSWPPDGALLSGPGYLWGAPVVTCLVLAMAGVLFFPPSTLVELAGPGSALVIVDASVLPPAEVIASAGMGTAVFAVRTAAGADGPEGLSAALTVQEALDRSVRVGASQRRVGLTHAVPPDEPPDPENFPNHVVVFDETFPGSGVFHGHARPSTDLDLAMLQALIRSRELSQALARGEPVVGDWAPPVSVGGVPVPDADLVGGDPVGGVPVPDADLVGGDPVGGVPVGGVPVPDADPVGGDPVGGVPVPDADLVGGDPVGGVPVPVAGVTTVIQTATGALVTGAVVQRPQFVEPPQALAGDVTEALGLLEPEPVVASLLVGAAMHDPDPAAVQEVCMRLLDGASMALACVAVTCLGHLARVHHEVGDGAVPALRGVAVHPLLGPVVLDALDDIGRYAPDTATD